MKPPSLENGVFPLVSASGGDTPQAEAPAAPAVAAPKAIEGRSLGAIAWLRLRRDKLTMVALYIAVFFVIVALVAPLFAKLGWIDAYNGNTELVRGIGSTPTKPWNGIDGDHWFGVEPGTGRDLFARVMLGISTSFTIALGATIIACIVGVVMGIIAGAGGGRLDAFIGRFIDFVLSFPQTLMLIAMSLVIIRGIGELISPAEPTGNFPRQVYLILFLGLFGWPGLARVIRGQVLSLREREFIEAARSIGSGRMRLYFTEILPNLWAPILVFASLIFPANIGAEAALSFLGVGIQPPLPSLGSILSDSVSYATAAPGFFFIPGGVLIFAVLSFNLLGDGLRDVLDPKAGRS